MKAKERRQKIIKSSHKALDELDKLILQTIDLEMLDPEKAKQAAQGKIEAIQGSLTILQVIAELEAMEIEHEEGDKKNDIFEGVENKIR